MQLRLWSLKNNIVAFCHPTNLQELIEAVNISWRQISIKTVNRLCNSFIQKIFLCQKNHRQCINHLLQSKMIENVTKQEITDLINQLTQDRIILEEIEFIKKKIE